MSDWAYHQIVTAMEYNDPWELIRQKRYQEAIEAYSRLDSAEHSDPYIRNRGIARLLIKDYAGALDDFMFVLTNSGKQH